MKGRSKTEEEDLLRRPLPDPVGEAIRLGKVRRLDVRTILAEGREPFQRIMETVGHLEPGEVFELLVPFEPVPLYQVLAGKGYRPWVCPPSDEDPERWTIFFYRGETAPRQETGEEEATEMHIEGEDGEKDGLLELDVSGLEPPEPLEQVMETVERMAYGDILKVRHHRDPLLLYPLLAERGLAWRSRKLADESWEIRIWRKS